MGDGCEAFTDAEWCAFQAIPDQGYSHRQWLNEHIAAHVGAAVAEARGEAERLRMSLRHQEVLTASIQEMLPPCHCDMNPETTDGPSEDCARHGRPYSYWVERSDEAANERGTARADRDRLAEAVRGLADEWTSEPARSVTTTYASIGAHLHALIAATDDTTTRGTNQEDV